MRCRTKNSQPVHRAAGGVLRLPQIMPSNPPGHANAILNSFEGQHGNLNRGQPYCLSPSVPLSMAEFQEIQGDDKFKARTSVKYIDPRLYENLRTSNFVSSLPDCLKGVS